MLVLPVADQSGVSTRAPGEAEIHRDEVDGVPVLWSEVPGPRRISVVFRTGRADETLVGAGLTHLVEHLALFALGDDDRSHNGFVDHLRTVFHATGSESELCEFVARVSEALTNLPLARVEEEKRVLLTEAASMPRGSWHGIAGLRFGARGFGLVDYPELGLRRPGSAAVAAWASERFVRENVAVWMTFPPPETLGLHLPSGKRSSPPTTAPIAELALPAYLPATEGAVVASFVGARSVELTIALTLLQRRLHEGLRLRRALSYSATGSYMVLSADLAHLTLGADCLDEHATDVRDQLVEELQRLATDGPEARELTDATGAITAAWAEEPTLVLGDLDSAATNELLDAPHMSREELRNVYASLTPSAIADGVRELLPTALLSAPTGASPPVGFNRYGHSGEPVRGRRSWSRGRRSSELAHRSPFAFADEGITYLPDEGDAVTVRYDEVAAVLELGPARLQLIATNGNIVRVDLRTHVRGAKLEQAVRQRVAPELFVPFDESRSKNVLNLAREKLGYRSRAAKEVMALPNVLERGEQVLTLAAAIYRRKRRGLLVLTNRRVLHLSGAGTRHPRTLELQLSDVAGFRGGRLELFSRTLVIRTTSGKKHTFYEITPGERATELREALASPIRPQVTPQRVDTSARGRVRAYAVGGAFALFGLLGFAASSTAGVSFWLLLFGSVNLFRTYRRRREMDSLYRSSTIVTGPSLTSSSSIFAPKTPVSTGTPSARSSAQNRS